MPTLTIDGKQITVEPGTVLIQACEQLGIEIPRFCYHERLNIAGNCRMCLVEVSPGPPKPQASCALPCADNMVVKTDSDMVKRAREGVMEFLLINHPLDCPICDQGGECDLQDQAAFYGRGTSRYHEPKRAVEDKYMGPLIKTEMTRCIHCTRCIRFLSEIAGVPDLGGLGRGEHMEVGTYVEKAIGSELSGNLVDLCPVGALTSKPYAFMARPWELAKTETVDVMDAVGSNIRVDSRGGVVMRVLPRLHEDINEEWISDKTRHACDGLRAQRLDRPYIRNAKGVLQEATWEQALSALATRLSSLNGSQISAIAGDQACVESMFALKGLMRALKSPHRDCRQDGAKLPVGARGDYLFNTGIAGIEQADVILFVGANPRIEAPLVNARIRKAWRAGSLKVLSLGAPMDLTYPHEHLGDDPSMLNQLLAGTHPAAQVLKNAKNPMVIVGASALTRQDGPEIYAATRALAEQCAMVRTDWNGFNVLHTNAARVGALDIGFLPDAGGQDVDGIPLAARKGDIRFVYLLGADEVDMTSFGRAFVVYQGHHGDAGAHRADIVLPGAAYTEKDATYVNMEGRVQQTRRAVFPPGAAREDWAIIRALSEVLEEKLPYDSLSQLRAALVAAHPHLAKIDVVERASLSAAGGAKTYSIEAAPLTPFIQNFYMTDPISRASCTMAQCTRDIAGRTDFQEAA